MATTTTTDQTGENTGVTNTTADQTGINTGENTGTTNTTADQTGTNTATTNTTADQTGTNTGTTNTTADQTVGHVDDKPTSTGASVVNEPTNFPTLTANNPFTDELPDHQSPPTGTAALNSIDSLQSSPTGTTATKDAIDSSSPGANGISADQPPNLQPSPTNTTPVHKSVDFQLPPTTITDVGQSTDTTGVHQSPYTPSSPPLNIDHTDGPKDHQFSTNNTAIVDEPISPQSASTKIETINEIKKSQSPLTNTANTADNEPLLVQAIPSISLPAEDITTPKQVVDTVVTDKSTNLEPPVSPVSPTTDPNQRPSFVTFLRHSAKENVFLGIILIISRK